jgi:hypothetical protein
MHLLHNVSLSARRLCLCAALLFYAIALLRAEIPPVPEYDVGDTAEADIRTPVVFDAIDPLATKQARDKISQNFSPVLRYMPQTGAEAEAEFRAAFEKQHAWFAEALQKYYHYSKLNQVTVEHPTFGAFLDWLQKQNPTFPCLTNVARAWALGDAGKAEELALKLRQTMRQYIHSDAVPAEHKEGPVRIFSVKGNEVIPDLDAVEKRSIEVSREKLYTLAEVRVELAKSFPSTEQPLAKFLSEYLRANCSFDMALTERLQKTRAANLWVTQHYRAGDVIVESGSVVDGKVKSALEALAGKRVEEQRKLAAAAARQEKINAIKESLSSACSAVYARIIKADPFDGAMVLTFIGVTIGLYMLRRHSKRGAKKPDVATAAPSSVTAYTVVLHPERQETIFLPVKTSETQTAPVTPAPSEPNLLRDASWEERARQAETHAEELLAMVRSGLAPHLAKELMNRLVQELIEQRRALLQTQQATGQEIASIEARFNTVYAHLQDQIKAYEQHAQHLEEKLANKDEENSELLKAMIAAQKKLQSAQTESEPR